MANAYAYDSAWGYVFDVDEQHLTPEQYQPLKFSYDVIAEEVLDRLNEISPPTQNQLPRNNSQFSAVGNSSPRAGDDNKHKLKLPQRDLYAILQEHAEKDDLLGRFWRDVNTVSKVAGRRHAFSLLPYQTRTITGAELECRYR